MIPLVLETIVRTLGQGSFRWVDDQPTKDDLDHIFKQTRYPQGARGIYFN
jgi:hypothetical protein